MITGIAHVAFVVGDLEASIDFYCGKLGMTEAFAFLREDASKSGAYLHVGGRTFLEFFEGERAAPAEGQPYRHICFEVDDINATVEALRTDGVEVTDVKLGGDGAWQAWTADPEGNRIELHQYTPESRQTPSLK